MKLITEDLVIDDVRDFKGETLKFDGGKIKGRGEIKNFYIEAHSRQNLFDDTITVNTLSPSLSSCWFGASPKFLDNSIPINKAIASMNRNQNYIREVYTPADKYNLLNPIKGEYIKFNRNTEKDEYAAWIGTLRGDGSRDNGTMFIYKGKKDYALNIQLGKGVKIENLGVLGQFQTKELAPSIYYKQTLKEFNDESCSNDRYRPYTGIAIDYEPPLDGKDKRGSSKVRINDCYSSGYTVCFGMSFNGITQNCDDIVINDPTVGEGLYGFAGGQDQAKITVRNVMSWSKLHTLVKPEAFGAQVTSDWLFNESNIAGNNINLVFNQQKEWGYGVKFQNMRVENLWSIGTVGGLMTAWRDNHFKGIAPEKVGQRSFIVVTPGSWFIDSNSIWRYFGSKSAMQIEGNVIFNQCQLSNEIITPITARRKTDYPKLIDCKKGYSDANTINGEVQPTLSLTGLLEIKNKITELENRVIIRKPDLGGLIDGTK